jgi:hypothetical protein
MANNSDNIFLPAFGVKPHPLIGRDDIIAEFIDGLKRPVGHPLRTIFISGQRGMGKTALLLELAERAAYHKFIVARVTSSERMLEEIIQTIQLNGEEHIPKPTKKLRGVSAGAMGFSIGLTFSDEVERKYGFRIKLSLLADELAKHGLGILILVDEVQSSGESLRELATTYQHLIGEGKNIAVSMAGLPGAVSEVLNDKVLTFLNRAHKVRLDPLPLPAVELYYYRAFTDASKQIGPVELAEAVQASRGYPYLVQLVGYYIMELAAADLIVSQIIVRNAVKSAKTDLVENVYRTSLSGLSEKDIQFLKAMAIDEKQSKSKDIRERMRVSNSYFQQYRIRLLQHGLISPEHRGAYSFTLPYMGEYLKGQL